ncbi:MAG: biotin--[acetyl-CoA-carboxylase] ligase [Nitriliruptoraceae bacterium]
MHQRDRTPSDQPPFADHPAIRHATEVTRFSNLEHRDEVLSTQDLARDRHRQPGEAVVVIADRQTAGRGRRGRVWIDDRRTESGSPTNVAISIALDAPAAPGLIPLMTGLAIVDAVRGLGIDDTRLKWPNDVVVGGSKVAGILVEFHPGPATGVRSPTPSDHGMAAVGTATGTVVIGCGINVDWRGIDRGGTLLTSLAEHHGADIDRGEIVASYLLALERRITMLADDPLAVLDAYRAVSATLGQRVRVQLPAGGTLAGLATGIDGRGSLVVDTEAGGQVAVTAGDVIHVR